jgi:predicted XRE-type DNA-binding protein
MSSTATTHYRKLTRARGYAGEEAEPLVQRAILIGAIKEIIEEKGWTQAEAAEHLGVKQPRIAELNQMCVEKFSTDLLIKYLYKLKRSVQVEVVNAKRSG